MGGSFLVPEYVVDNHLWEHLLRLHLHYKTHVNGHTCHVTPRKVQDRPRYLRAAYVHVHLQVVARQRPSQEARRVTAHHLPHDSGPLHDPVHGLEPGVVERVVLVHESVEERLWWRGILGREVEDRLVLVLPRDLEIDDEEEGLGGAGAGAGGDAVVWAG